MGIVYLIIAFAATFIGSMTGAAGGVIMKPILDLFSSYDAITIGILSAITLSGMGIVNITTHIFKKTKIEWKILIPIAIGSTMGGIIGGEVLKYIAIIIENDSTIKVVQNFILILVMVISICYVKFKDKVKSYSVSGKFSLVIVGIVLGIISTFLGIGGGPINVAVLMFVLSFSTKDAAVYSIGIVIFAQIAKVFFHFINMGINKIDLTVLPYMLAGGIVGGYLGAKFNKIFPEKIIVIMFNLIQVFVIITCFLNILIKYNN